MIVLCARAFRVGRRTARTRRWSDGVCAAAQVAQQRVFLTGVYDVWRRGDACRCAFFEHRSVCGGKQRLLTRFSTLARINGRKAM